MSSVSTRAEEALMKKTERQSGAHVCKCISD